MKDYTAAEGATDQAVALTEEDRLEAQLEGQNEAAAPAYR